ncbi:hypothetical protein VTK73DRAFT_2014 [Phialemonium thermophilum]|uniref:Ubiquitin-like domain-containing protein n=1 Tax=Phialemonium thermophilum TaxID=223376 RepID=A0ABR3VSQ7_9PEZI
MGCCLSSPSGPSSPYPGGAAASASARAINDQTLPVGPSNADESLSSPASTTTHHPRHRRRNNDQPLDQHINKPLRRHEWASRSRVWTPLSLARERQDFFDTRVTGRQEVWQALHAALELMWEADAAARQAAAAAATAAQSLGATAGGWGEGGEGGGGGGSKDEAEDGRVSALAMAQTILDAADITLPTGDLAQGAYDLMGNYYQLPEYVVSDPINISLVEHHHHHHHRAGSRSGCFGDNKPGFTAGEESADEDDLEDDDDDEDGEIEQSREEKGKAVLDVRDLVPLKARLSEGALDVSLSIGRGERVRSVAQKIREKSGLPNSKRIRIAYMGKILKETSSLPSQGWKEGHIVNALIFDR